MYMKIMKIKGGMELNTEAKQAAFKRQRALLDKANKIYEAKVDVLKRTYMPVNTPTRKAGWLKGMAIAQKAYDQACIKYGFAPMFKRK
jgi:hypothetical protein